MKKALVASMFLLFNIFSITTYGQGNDISYRILWNTVQKYELQDLPKSAAAVVDSIYDQAKNERNHPQLVKTLIYKSKFMLTLEEDAQLKVVNQFKEEISVSGFPVKHVLEGVLANLYWQYYQQNRWKFYNRTKTDGKVDASDFRTWDLETLFLEVHHHYQNSLADAPQLQKVDLKDFNEILILEEGSKIYRPTLFDFLAHNALDFYKSGETSITQPAYKFEIEDSSYFTDFINLELKASDSTSLNFNALKIYQQLLRFHSRDGDPTAFVTVDLERLEFIKNNARLEAAEQLYLEALRKFKAAHPKHAISTTIDYQIAYFYNNQANEYQSKTAEEHRFKRKMALDICEEAVAKFPDSRGAKNCALLINDILSKHLSIKAEAYTPIGSPSRLLVEFKNIDSLSFRIFKVKPDDEISFRQLKTDSAKIAFLSLLKEQQNWNTILRNEFDYQQHSSEVVVPALPQGSYIIVATEKKGSINEDQVFGYGFVQVTNLALIQTQENYEYRYQVINRNNGAPISGAKLEIYNRDEKKKKVISNKVTDKDGFSILAGIKNHYDVHVRVKTKEDEATFGSFYLYNYGRNRSEEKEEITVKSFIFTDRSIYRPGQTVYFKGVLLKFKGTKSEIVPNEYVEVNLEDVNYQEVSTLKLKTNEFGSFSGAFILPIGGLTGIYTINVEEDNEEDSDLYDLMDEFNPGVHTISVEEYKRPKFETQFEPVTETYQLNDTISVRGTAVAFAGSNITGAKVVYRVHRKVQYPPWFYWHRPYGGYSSESQEITHGETVTNADGGFSIDFTAIPDLSVSRKDLPVFNYEILADVTDLNGETRSATTVVKVGYHALLATMQIPGAIKKEALKQQITITTQNLNGEFVPAKGTIKIFKLVAPENVLRQRSWTAPDYQEITKAEFKKLFPHDPYENEDNEANWQKGKLVFEADFNTSADKEIFLKGIEGWANGKYIAELESNDNLGQLVKDQQQFNLHSEKDKKVADNALFTISTDKNSYKPGEKVNLKVGSAAKDLYVTLEVEKDHKIVSRQRVHLNNTIKTLQFPVGEGDLGGFAIRYSLAAFNGYKSGIIIISVPKAMKKLEIETLTFRDKLQPGESQTWAFKIKGESKDLVLAETLAGMYDASLDQFKPHTWNFNPFSVQNYYSLRHGQAHQSFEKTVFTWHNLFNRYGNYEFRGQQYDALDWFGFSFTDDYYLKRQYLTGSVAAMADGELVMEEASLSMELAGQAAGVEITNVQFDSDDVLIIGKVSLSDGNTPLYVVDGVIVDEFEFEKSKLLSMEVLKGVAATAIYGARAVNGVIVITTKEGQQKLDEQLAQVKVRTNLQETAFFLPHLTTDKEGNISFNFTAPEALTRWKLQLLAHTKDLEIGMQTFQTVTQKDLMVIPNAPRFLRQGDEIVFSAKIANLTPDSMNGFAALQLFDAISGKTIDEKLGNIGKSQSFQLDAKGNTQVSWKLTIPDDIQSVQYNVVAKAGDFSDGEQSALPVLSNRMLVTETLPMWIRSDETKTFTLNKLKNNSSTSLKHHLLTLEMTSNPAWYAVQSLPYLMEFPYECAEQTFAKFYANTLGSHIVNSNPRVKAVFDQWAASDALSSSLEKNEELKSIIIQETPWLRDAQDETEQKKRMSLLFDLNKMKEGLETTVNKLQEMQMGDGGFPWFQGNNYPNRYITQHIVSGYGHLRSLKVAEDSRLTRIMDKALEYLDKEILKDYERVLEEAENIRKNTKDKAEGIKKEKEYLKSNHLTALQIQYLYMRSFYEGVAVPEKVKVAVDYYRNQSATYWKEQALYMKGMIALVQHRIGNKEISVAILNSLDENSITSDEMGMYWKENKPGWYWQDAPVETQALMVEVFSEIERPGQHNDARMKIVDELKIWLLKNKQTNRWSSTKATTEAVYALLLQGSDWISITDMVNVSIGNKEITPAQLEAAKAEAGTGYFKTAWHDAEITPAMSEVKVTKAGKGVAWGGLYWQYFEDLDKITGAETPLKLNKKLFLKKNTDTGEEISLIDENTSLQIGDLLRVRIELKVDREMDFVHMKDMRASGLEPVNVLSQYKWQDGLGYYESTRDASTNFFFDRLPKGVYVFEYDLRVNNKGDFSNGITTIQCMYAPEFSSHSEGIRVEVK